MSSHNPRGLGHLHHTGMRTNSRSLLPSALYRWMSLADTAVMVNRQRLPLLPMNIGFSNTPTCDAVLVTGHHTTGFPVSNFWESCDSALATPR